MTPEEKVARGEEARRLIEHPLMTAAWEELEQAFIDKAITFQTRSDQDRIEKCRLMDAIGVLRRVKAMVEDHIATGKIAVSEVERIAREKKGIFKR